MPFLAMFYLFKHSFLFSPTILFIHAFIFIFCDYQSIKGQGRTTAMWMAIGKKTRKKSEFDDKIVKLKDQNENPEECSSQTENRRKSHKLQNYDERTMDHSMESSDNGNRGWDNSDEERFSDEKEEEEEDERRKEKGKENITKNNKLNEIEQAGRFADEIGGERERSRATVSLSGQRDKKQDHLNIYQSSVHGKTSGRMFYFILLFNFK